MPSSISKLAQKFHKAPGVATLKIFWSFIHRLRITLGITPFKILYEMPNGLVFLSARINTPLSGKREVIAIPKDNMIYTYVKNYGEWGSIEANYLASIANKEHYTSSRITLIDFGAHAGLVSKIFLDKFIGDKIEVILVDPLPVNLEAQTHNLRKYSKVVTQCEMAITPLTGVVQFEIDLNNIGASQVKKGLITFNHRNIVEVPGISAQQFELKYLQNFNRIVYKSDLEGLDAKIINQFSENFWNRMVGGIIELDPHSNLEKEEIKALSRKFSNFNLSLNSDMSQLLSTSDLNEILGSVGRSTLNLYFNKE